MGYLSCRTEAATGTRENAHLKHKRHRPANPRIFKYEDLEKATRGFAAERLLGKGSHGCVYKGVLQNGKLVAVKRPTYARQLLQDETSFDNELEILSKLGGGDHVVNLLGYSCDSIEKILVVEFMANGTLHDSLHNSIPPINWFMRIQLALQTAKGILRLHSASPPVIHRDIKSSNVMIDEKWNAKLGDFGLALRGHIEDVLKTSTPRAGTMGYLDPEYETPSDLSTKTDVFSFGILLFEIVSGRHAIDLACEPPSILDWVVPLVNQGAYVEVCDKKLSLPVSFKPLKQLINLAIKCVRSSSENPPHMSDVVEELKEISRKISFSTFNGFTRVVQRNMVSTQQRPRPGVSARRVYRGPSQGEDKAMCSKLTKLEREGATVEARSAQVLGMETAITEPPAGFFALHKPLPNPLASDGNEVEFEMPFRGCKLENASSPSTNQVIPMELDNAAMREHNASCLSAVGQCNSWMSSRTWIQLGASRRPMSPCRRSPQGSCGNHWVLPCGQHVINREEEFENCASRLTSSHKTPLSKLSATPTMTRSSLCNLAEGSESVSSPRGGDAYRHTQGLTPSELQGSEPNVQNQAILESPSSAAGATTVVSDNEDSVLDQMQNSQLEV
ncbi:unnamed protein product [Sphagnum jensenii]|uniref:Protein kinase domain-containing protein n=2 Tax=Sphagnum jensenii TaxID=128206 RepID=A0ABP0X9A7_9BRYO